MDYLPISKVNTVVYCSRRFYLEYVLGEVHRNHHIIEGSFLHSKAYTEPGERSGVWVWSDRLGLVGIIDRVEYQQSKTVLVEYKVGKAREQANHSDSVQLAAQALCLMESRGEHAEQGYVYYHGSRIRREVELGPELLAQAEEAVTEMRWLLKRPKPPGVSVPRSKCEGCSVQEACQPNLLRGLRGEC